jgi:hypothetical protein
MSIYTSPSKHVTKIVHHTQMLRYDDAMRTTLDLSMRVHAGLTELAKQKGKTMSAVANDLLYAGLFMSELPPGVHISPVTGLAQVSLGRAYTMEEIAELIDEDN